MVIKRNKNALAGNRTRAARVAGEHSTTEPPVLDKRKNSRLIHKHTIKMILKFRKKIIFFNLNIFLDKNNKII